MMTTEVNPAVPPGHAPKSEPRVVLHHSRFARNPDKLSLLARRWRDRNARCYCSAVHVLRLNLTFYEVQSIEKTVGKDRLALSRRILRVCYHSNF